MSGRFGRMALDATHVDKLRELSQKLIPYTKRDAFATRMGITAVPRSLATTASEIAKLSNERNNKALVKVHQIATRLERAISFDDRDAIPGLISELMFAIGDAHVSEVNLSANSVRSGGFSQLDRLNAEKRAKYEKEQQAGRSRLSQVPRRGFGP